MADRPPELRDYADFESERQRLGDRLASRLQQELERPDSTPKRRSPMRWLFVTTPLAAAALVAAALAPSLLGERAPEHDPAPQHGSVRDHDLGAGQGLHVNASLDQGMMLLGSGEDRFLVVEFDAAEVTARAPVHIAAVVDTSGSMAGDRKITYAQQALLALAAQLGPEDTLSIVGFDDEARLWLPAGPAVDNPRVFEAISALVPQGGTNIGAGLRRGLAELAQLERPGARRVVLLSDGISDEPRDSLAALAGSRVEQGITVSALGLGLDFDSAGLLAISDAGGGRYRYVDRPEALASLFEEELGTLTRLASRGVSLQVELADGVEVRSVYGYGQHDGEVSAHGYRALVGDMHAGQQRKVVARLRVPDGVVGDQPVAKVRVGYTPPGGERQTLQLDVGTFVTDDPRAVAHSVRRGPSLHAARAIQGDALQRSQSRWSSGDAEAAARAWRDGAEALSSFEAQLGADVTALRLDLEQNGQQLQTLEPGSSSAAPLRLQLELQAVETME